MALFRQARVFTQMFLHHYCERTDLWNGAMHLSASTLRCNAPESPGWRDTLDCRGVCGFKPYRVYGVTDLVCTVLEGVTPVIDLDPPSTQYYTLDIHD